MTPTTARKPRRTAHQERARLTVEAILEAAAQVFERYGYAGGTTNHIAKRAGVSIGSLYDYFPDKDAIVVELSRRHIAEVDRIASPTLAELVQQAPPLRDGLETLVWGMIGLHRQAPRLHEVLFEQTPRSEQITTLLSASTDRATSSIAAYLSNCPEVAAADTTLAARILVETIDAVTHRLVIHPRPDTDPDVYARETITMLERYLTT